MTLDFAAASSWRPPADWPRVRTLDAHTGGEPFRVVLDGAPQIPGATMLAKRRWAQEHADTLRRLLMLEPRGHADMYGCLLTEPTSPEADFGILFLHNAGFSTMCGHGILAITKVALEAGLVPDAATRSDLVIDTPAGVVHARAERRQERVERIAFRNVPSFAVDLDVEIDVPGLGMVRYDLAFGGAYYAVVDCQPLGLEIVPTAAAELIVAGREIRRAIAATAPIEHPLEPDLGFLYGVIFVGPPADAAHHSRNACVFADGEVDRSPTGTGVSARLAIHHARGDLAGDGSLEVESILGSTFRGRVAATTTCGNHPAVVPEIEGRAWISGRHEFCLDPNDPFPQGFFLR